MGHCEKVGADELHPFDLEATTRKTTLSEASPRPSLTPSGRKKINELASLDRLSTKNKERI